MSALPFRSATARRKTPRAMRASWSRSPAPSGCCRGGRRIGCSRRAASLAGVKRLEPGKAIVGAAQPPAQLAVDVLHHDHIAVDVALVIFVELLRRELVQHGRTLRDHGGGA